MEDQQQQQHILACLCRGFGRQVRIWNEDAVAEVQPATGVRKRSAPVFLEIIGCDFIFPKKFGGIWHLLPSGTVARVSQSPVSPPFFIKSFLSKK